MASTIRDRVGVNIHTAQSNYSNRGLVSTCLDYLGVTRVRDNAPSGASTTGLTQYKFLTICGTSANVAAAKAAGADELEVVNEGDLAFGTSGTNLTAWKNNVAATVTAVNRTKRLIGPSMTGADKAVGYSTPFGEFPGVDTANAHLYRANASAGAWADHVSHSFANAKVTAPYRPIMVTEFGAHDYSGANNHGHVYTPAATWGTQIVPQILDYLTAGAERCYVYELIDNSVAKSDDSEGHFGLFTATGTPKPAAVALKAFLDKYGDYDITSIPSLADQISANQTTIDTQSAQINALQAQINSGGGSGGGGNNVVTGPRELINFKTTPNLGPRLLDLTQPGASETTIYRVPSGHGMKLSSASVYNPTASAISLFLSVVAYGSTGGNGNRVYSASIAAGGSVSLKDFLVGAMLGAGDFISGTGNGLILTMTAADAF